jgi:hypothetical protein
MSGGAWKENGLMQYFLVAKYFEAIKSNQYEEKNEGKYRRGLWIEMNQIYKSEIKDLFRQGYEAPPQLKMYRLENP